MIWFDIEGTLIDDLTERNWLDISRFNFNDERFGIFTWGWFDASEIDKGLIKLFEEKLGAKCDSIITKANCMEFERLAERWFWAGELTPFAEESFNEKFTKDRVFVDIMKDGITVNHSFSDVGLLHTCDTHKENTLIDDVIEEDCVLTFPKKGTTVTLIRA